MGHLFGGDEIFNDCLCTRNLHSVLMYSPVIFCLCCHLPESVFAPLPNAQRGVPLILTGDPKGQNFLYCVGNSVIIRNIEVRGGDGRGGGGGGEGWWRGRVEGEGEGRGWRG